MLAGKVSTHMQSMGMPDGRFDVDVAASPGDEPGATGADRWNS